MEVKIPKVPKIKIKLKLYVYDKIIDKVTLATTIVEECKSEDTGVGLSIAIGNQKLNKNKNQSTNLLEDENKNIYQTNFVSDSTEEMKSVKKSLIKKVTTPKVQLYEYPVEETISYLTEPEKNSATTIPSDFSDEDLKTKPRRLYPTSYESLDESLSSTQP